MDRRESARTQWLWVALGLQAVVFLISVWSAGQMLASWPKYAACGTQMIPYLVRSIVEVLLLGVSLLGLWRSKYWGWLLGVLVDAASCVLYLYYVVGYPRLLLNPRYLALNIWEFGAFAVLLHQPVRDCLQVKKYFHVPAAPPVRTPVAEMNALQRSFRVLVYFAVAVAATCVVTAFSLSVMMGDKAGGFRGFVFLLLIGLEIGSAASFLFVVLLTVVGRGFGPGRLGVWLIAGALLAPGLILGMGLLVKTFQSGSVPQGTGPLSMLLNIFFTGPMYLLQVWWLAIPAGIVTSFLCCQMYPWTFGPLE